MAALAGEAPSAARRLGLAVSGGGDSVALLLLAAAAWPGAVVAASVDHGLRAAAADEARDVGRLCARLGVGHDVLRAPAGFGNAGNLQDAARRVRYRLLVDWAAGAGAAWVATGHQRDDVAETFLMRARRGAGTAGLAAMADRRPVAGGLGAALLVRPLLGWSRAELAAIVAAAGVMPASDPSNADPRFERSRIRALLAAAPDLSAAGLALAARNLRDAEKALAWVTEREWAVRAEVARGTVLLDVTGLPHELVRRLAGRALGHVAPGAEPAWRGTALDRLVRLLEAGRPATLAGVLARPGPRWRFVLAPPRTPSGSAL